MRSAYACDASHRARSLAAGRTRAAIRVVSHNGLRIDLLLDFPEGGGYDHALPFAERSGAASRRWGDYGADIAGSSHTLLHSESAVHRSRDRIGRSITILMVAIPLYCKSLGFQFETKLCIFQNISKYFFEKIPHVLLNVQYGDNQADITKMLNVGDDPAEWDFRRVPPPTPHLRPHFRNLRLSGTGHANEAVRFSKHNRWRPKEMQSAGLCGL